VRYIDACHQNRWHLQLWRRGEPDGDRLSVPFRCKSWRHAGECREYCGACDYVRCMAGLRKYKTWSMLVLTYPQREWPRNQMDNLFRFGVKSWGSLRKKLIANLGPIKYLQTWEIHKSGYPHVNVVIANKSLQVHATEADRRRTFCKPRSDFVKGPLTEFITESGFGPQFHLSALRDRLRVAGYLVKLANELAGSGPKDQTPVNAPRHFRRLRASVGLLPPRNESEEFTGQIMRFPLPATEPGPDGEIPLAEF
jgi:hypothetical protein